MSRGKFSQKWLLLIENGQPLLFHKGQTLFYEGHFPYGVYWVRKGDVKFSHKGRCNERHDKQSASSLHEQWPGFSELVTSNLHCCTCEATTDCEVVFVNKNQFLSLLPNLPAR